MYVHCETQFKITKDKATLFHMLATYDFPSYAYKANDSLIFRLDFRSVPVT